jgi:hypothetical protein
MGFRVVENFRGFGEVVVRRSGASEKWCLGEVVPRRSGASEKWRVGFLGEKLYGVVRGDRRAASSPAPHPRGPLAPAPRARACPTTHTTSHPATLSPRHRPQVRRVSRFVLNNSRVKLDSMGDK